MNTPQHNLRHTRVWLRLVACCALVVVAFGAPAQHASTAFAADNGEDFASSEIGNPWDMSDANDIVTEYTRKSGNWSNFSVADGQFQGTAKALPNNLYDPNIILLIPSDPHVNPVPSEGGYTPINTSKYRYATVRMFASAGASAQFVWSAASGAAFGSSVFQDVRAGAYQTFTIDLTASGRGSGGAAWNSSGTMQLFRFDPSTGAGEFKIDYIRLSTTVPENPDNTPPVTAITSPSYISGPDYASTVVGNAWDMDSAADVAATNELTGVSYTNGVLNATNIAVARTTGDPQITLRTLSAIDTNKYKYATVRMQIDGALDTDAGSVARFLWWTTIPERGTTTNSFVVYEGFRTTSFDLSKVKLENLGGKLPWASSQPIVFRFDPLEFPTSRSFHIDYVMLTGDNTANTSYDIRYTSTANARVQFFADTDNNVSNGGGTEISCAGAVPVPQLGRNNVFLPLGLRSGAAAPVTPSGNTCRWDTSNVAAGTYYIHTVTTDGIDTTNAYSQTPVIVSH